MITILFKSKRKLDAKLAAIQEELNREKEGVNLLKELDKLLPMAPVVTGIEYYNEYPLYTYSCGNCKREIGNEQIFFARCPLCGQKTGSVK